jgi:hypothetical protein
MWEKLKQRWNVKSNVQVIIILVVFALTGSTLLYVKRPVYEWIGVTKESHFAIKIIAFFFIALPLYQIMLLCYGTLLGQFRFFWNFEKKIFGRIVSMFSKKSE